MTSGSSHTAPPYDARRVRPPPAHRRAPRRRCAAPSRDRHPVLPPGCAERRLLRRPVRRPRHPPDRDPPRAGRGVHGDRCCHRDRASERVLRRAGPGDAQRVRRVDDGLLEQRPRPRRHRRDPVTRPAARLGCAARAPRPDGDPVAAHQAGRARRRSDAGRRPGSAIDRRGRVGTAAPGRHRGGGRPLVGAGRAGARRPRRRPADGRRQRHRTRRGAPRRRRSVR